MTPRRARQLLGLSPDADAREIRRAYAGALRAIDPDADPRGFAELRDARDAALADARARVDEGKGQDAGASPGQFGSLEDSVPRRDPDTMVPPPPTEDEVRDAAMAEHARALAAILTPDHPAGVYLDADEQAAAHSHLDALLADPRLDGLEMRIWAEQWYADLAVAAHSRADPMLSRLVAFFGWQRDQGSLGQSDAVAAAVGRYDEVIFVNAVSDPKHRHHSAWNVLTGERSGWRNLFVRTRRVRDLIALVRRDHPGVEQYFDSVIANNWEHGRFNLGSVRPLIFGVWLVIAVVRFALSSPGADLAAPPPVAPLIYASAASSPEQELPSVLAVVGGPDLTLARVDRENRVLGQWLRERWKIVSNGSRDLAGGDARLQHELFARAGLEQQRTTYAIAAEAVRLHLDEARSTEQFGWPTCVGYWQGKPLPAAVAGRFVDRRQTLAGRLLLAGRFDRPDPPYDGSYRVSGAAVERIAARAGVSVADVRAALHNRGAPKAQCQVYQALAEVALELPRKEGLPILRKL